MLISTNFHLHISITVLTKKEKEENVPQNTGLFRFSVVSLEIMGIIFKKI